MMTNGRASAPIRVLIVDDDAKLCELLREYLASFGFNVASAHTGPAGLQRALDGDCDIVVLDLMLPGMDGVEVLRQLRKHSDIPVLMLTARGDETDRVVGLEVGADDYVSKTASHRELLARLRALARRHVRSAPASLRTAAPAPIALGGLRIALASRTAELDGARLDLTPLEFDLLVCLARAAGRIRSRMDLLEELTGRDFESFDRSIDVHISALRRKLGDDPKQPRFIKTVRAAGYMFLRPGGRT
jgi:DNA-binding response OmpR family regulator